VTEATEAPGDNRPDCRRFLRDLYHYQAGELPDAEREALARHVGACPPCAERQAFEDAFLRGLKRRLGRTLAPPGLRARVVERLRGEPAPSGWLGAPWVLPAAASLLLALALIPALRAFGPGAPVHIVQEVTVVDFACDQAGVSLHGQRGCADPQHLNALKVSSASYWNVSLDTDASRSLVTDPGMRGHRLRVEGDLYAGIRTLRLSRFTDEGMDLLSAAAALRAAGSIPGGGDP
jgi:anti-sigma factor (TIGR02949 family)